MLVEPRTRAYVLSGEHYNGAQKRPSAEEGLPGFVDIPTDLSASETRHRVTLLHGSEFFSKKH